MIIFLNNFTVISYPVYIKSSMAFIENFVPFEGNNQFENEDNLPNGNAFRGEDWRDIRENEIRDDEIVMEPSQIFSYRSTYDDLELVKNSTYMKFIIQFKYETLYIFIIT